MKKIFFAAILVGAIFMSNAFSQNVKLNSGYQMPLVGLGTWTLTGKSCEDSVYCALKSGYRLIDTARYYGNETEVGNALARAIKDGIVKRGDVFVTTKIVPWSTNPASDIEDSLQKLGIEYIDLCLLHQHGSNDDEVYRAMEQAAKNGKIRSIGISNFYTQKTVSHFINDFEIKPAVIQNENHLFCQGIELQTFCKKYGIFIESYYPFGGRGHTKEHLQNPTVLRLAKKYNKGAGSILVRFHIQSGFIAIPGSSNPLHIKENFDIWDFELTTEELESLKSLNKNQRYESW